MRPFIPLVSATIALVAACSTASLPEPPASALLAGFTPPEPAVGEMRLVAPLVTKIAPGADITWCEYIASPFDRDVDVVASRGYQSHAGHHTLLMDVVGGEKRLGQRHECTDEDMTNARFLAGGSDGIAKFSIPEGIAFRVKRGSVLMVQSHWINTSNEPIDGQTVFNIKAVEPDPARQQAQLFAAYTANVNLPPRGEASATTDCSFGRDIDFFALGGHAHEWGSHVKLSVRRGDTWETFYDQAWEPQFQSDPPLNYYDPKKPFHFAKGDVLRVECKYKNSTNDTIRFPREMCVGEGFFFPGTADIQCADGRWIDKEQKP